MKTTRTGKMAIAVVLAAVTLAPHATRADVSSAQVASAIQKGLKRLRSMQDKDGSWAYRRFRGRVFRGSSRYTLGTTSLVVLAMLNAGVPPQDRDIQEGMAYIAKTDDEYVYSVSLKCQALSAYILADPKNGRRYLDELRKSATYLIKTQLDNGMWSYKHYRGRSHGRGDNSNTQFALLGLHEAAKAGIKVPREIWLRSRKHFENTQLKDGGWPYRFSGRRARRGSRSASYGSMTAAGVASLYICGLRLHTGGRRVFVRGAYPNCGKYTQDVVLSAGLKWLGENFSVTTNPPLRSLSVWHYYYLYALERVGMISGLRMLGKHDWYREGAAYLVKKQDRDGSWGRYGYDTAFGLLYLAKGNRPVIIQKLKWRIHGIAGNEWNRNIHDLENLTNWMGDKLGKRTTWQTVNLKMSLEELRSAPILYITGHVFPNFSKAEKKKLRAFVESGGTLLCEACCGSAGFKVGFREFAKDVFGDYGPVKDLGKGHLVYSSYYKLGQDFDTLYGLKGIDVGCRTGVLFAPKALGVLWELEDIAKRPTEEGYSKLAYMLGTNIAAYATGREQLRDKLDVVELPPAVKHAGVLKEAPRGAVRIGRLFHNGDYNADPHALVNLAAMLREKAKIAVVSKRRILKPTAEEMYEYPVVFMTGHHSFAYSDEQIEALRKYLQRGGTLIADACCGRKAFDKSFREMVAKLFPDEAFERLPRDHAIFNGNAGVALGELKFRRLLAKELKKRGTSHPSIEAVKLKGRPAILYSKYDFSCALEGDKPYSSRGYVDADGRKLALNLFLYAITY